MKHPSTAVSFVAGAGGGPFVVWLLSLLGLQISVYPAAALAGAVASLGVFVWHVGLQGLLHHLWRGGT